MAKFKTEKRKANVGERILITNADLTFGDYDNGDVLTVIGFHNEDSVLVSDDNDFPQIYTKEYEVIVEDKPSKNERITQLESKVAELEAKVNALEKADNSRPSTITITADGINITGPTVTITQPQSKKPHLYLDGLVTMPTPNEQRKATIERAKAFVAKQYIRKDTVYSQESGPNSVEFVINYEKRTVVALLRRKIVNPKLVRHKAIAKCAPDDVFNADIGKAIALGRALGLDVSEFENAVKPTEVVVGMVVTNTEEPHWGTGKVRELERMGCDGPQGYWVVGNSYNYVRTAIILDDTEAQY